jgi:hypothetical protein
MSRYPKKPASEVPANTRQRPIQPKYGAVYDSLLRSIRRGIPFHREHPIAVSHKGGKLATPYRADFACY